ncbi:MAG: dicarboxylate/amino acid:cation symporter [Proteobacteria bacterium]|nr:dicarboxylate/amino acid:cation symporter [Pseudomonadota bacterium]
MKLLRSLYFQVILAILCAVLVGHFFPAAGVAFKPLGDLFIKLVKLVIGPIIFCTIVSGIANVESMKQVGRTGGLALVYFEILSTLALIVGLIVVNVLKPGAGMNVDPSTLDAAAVAAYAGPGKLQSVPDFLMSLVPVSVMDAFARGDILQILVFAMFFGVALHALGPRVPRVKKLVDASAQVMFAITGLIMYLAPLGAFGAMAFTVGQYGIGSLASLGRLMGSFYLTCLIFILLVLGTVARLHGFRILRLIRFIRDEMLIVLGTSSSETVLPLIMRRLEALGADKSVVGLVIPAGYSFNLDGTAIYLTMAAVFVAQAINMPMDLWHQVTLLLVLLLTSKGAAAVTGSGFIVLAATLSAVGTVPVAGLALILGIDRFMSETRALTNIVGNSVATLVVAKWTCALDEGRLRRELGLRSGS